MTRQTREFGMIRCTVDPGRELVVVETIEAKRPILLGCVCTRMWGREEIEAALGAARTWDAQSRSAFSRDQLAALLWAAKLVAAAIASEEIW